MGKVRGKWSDAVKNRNSRKRDCPRVPYVPDVTPYVPDPGLPRPWAKPQPCVPCVPWVQPLVPYPWYPWYPNHACMCGKPLLLYIPPGQYARPCPVHPEYTIYSPVIYSLTTPLTTDCSPRWYNC